MTIQQFKKQIEIVKKRLFIAQLKLRIAILKQRLTIPDLPGPKHIVIHHDAGGWSFEQVNNYHQTKWGFKSSLGFYAGYHYYIEKSGRIYQARADNEMAAHAVEVNRPGYWNKNSLGVCLQGNFMKKGLIEEQIKTLGKFIYEKRAQYGIPRKEIYGHRDISPTLCPGDKLYKWVQDYKRS